MAQTLSSQATTYRNVAVFSLAVAAVGILAPLPTDFRMTLGIFGTMGAAGFGLAWLCAPRPLRSEAPDVLGQVAGGYFERDGLCFAPRLVVEDGLCWFTVYCQNRFAHPAHGTAWFVPMEGMRNRGPHEVLPIAVDIGCAPGEAAAVSIPYPIARTWQGRIMVYDVFARVKYPDGRGAMVRGGEGSPVGELASDLFETLKTAGLLAVGVLSIPRGAASCELRFPDRVAEVVPAGVAPRREVLWELDVPTGGFPVSPAER